MGDPPDPSSSPATSRERIAALQRLVGLADALIGSVKIITVASVGAGSLFWIAIFFPFRLSITAWLGAVAVLLVATSPGLVMVLLYLGFQEVRRVPERISELHRQGRVGVRELTASVRRSPGDQEKRSPWRLLRALWEMRSLAGEARGLAVQYLAIARLANPVTAIAVTISLVAAGGLGAIAVIVIIVRMA